MDPYRDELLQLGYTIVTDDATQLVALRSKWHWDCVASKITFVVYVRPVERLTAQMIAADREPLIAHAKALDPSKLPPGFQKGLAVVPVYIADVVEPDARLVLEGEQAFAMGIFYFPAAFDRASGSALFLRRTPVLGWVLFSKLRHVAGRLLEPAQTPSREPVSKLGALLMVSVAVLIPLSCGMMGFAVWLLASMSG